MLLENLHRHAVPEIVWL